MLKKDGQFSYSCRACGHCCRDKRIQVNPYEILRLSKNLGFSSQEFIERYLAEEGPYIQFESIGACPFLKNSSCTVYPDRPLVCRLYPLGRYINSDGNELFSILEKVSDSRGTLGKNGTIEDYLIQQGAAEFIHAVDQYYSLYQRIFHLLQETGYDSRLHNKVSEDMNNGHFDSQWLDAETTVKCYCSSKGVSLPEDIERIFQLHIVVLEQWLDGL